MKQIDKISPETFLKGSTAITFLLIMYFLYTTNLVNDSWVYVKETEKRDLRRNYLTVLMQENAMPQSVSDVIATCGLDPALIAYHVNEGDTLSGIDRAIASIAPWNHYTEQDLEWHQTINPLLETREPIGQLQAQDVLLLPLTERTKAFLRNHDQWPLDVVPSSEEVSEEQLEWNKTLESRAAAVAQHVENHAWQEISQDKVLLRDYCIALAYSTDPAVLTTARVSEALRLYHQQIENSSFFNSSLLYVEQEQIEKLLAINESGVTIPDDYLDSLVFIPRHNSLDGGTLLVTSGIKIVEGNFFQVQTDALARNYSFNSLLSGYEDVRRADAYLAGMTFLPYLQSQQDQLYEKQGVPLSEEEQLLATRLTYFLIPPQPRMDDTPITSYNLEELYIFEKLRDSGMTSEGAFRLMTKAVFDAQSLKYLTSVYRDQAEKTGDVSLARLLSLNQERMEGTPYYTYLLDETKKSETIEEVIQTWIATLYPQEESAKTD